MSIFEKFLPTRPDPELISTVDARLRLALEKARDNAVYSSRNASPVIAAQSEAEVLQMLANEQAGDTFRTMNVPTVEAAAVGSAILANEIAQGNDANTAERTMLDEADIAMSDQMWAEFGNMEPASPMAEATPGEPAQNVAYGTKDDYELAR